MSMATTQPKLAENPADYHRRFNASMVAGGIMLALVVLMALVSVLWTPYDPTKVVAAKLLAPSAQHWLGTDRLGYDVTSVIMSGAQTTLEVGLIAVAVAALIGVPYGIACGMVGSNAGRWLMRWNDVVQAFPPLLLAIIFTAVLGQSTVTAALALGIGASPAFARVARSATLQIMGREFILGARAADRGVLFIAWKHVLPNIRGLIIIQLSVNFAVAVLAEAGLSYLGLGTPAPEPSWGRLLKDSSAVIYSNWFLVLVPGIAIAWTVLAFNLLGDGLRDFLDPRLEGQS
ncbi:MAG: ABC transporter permease [Bifidobacterium tibiigranuli]|jgi:ABC-type dipeptide/oligopeptide/nickel transport system permease subunit|uniref:ABC transporter permease n=2 Tax=Bifidobacterium tibiigranuli TaxID=2172043 RepID=UPI002356CABD|nr:ABC transporter permease [Bifidobacterium tibiigranuli]MCH3975223.1 ABC transporter permease [Bifidobacterium tibiigranuli]MCH4203421.1 ABC transporter permease [Bifidobacterium tibiigranuli]MCH4273967.1 ABC transporter permease [Bifidobacterium tibiigranuli]MCI1834646.1 ABC transporter permease [Bifidobacterium tibiigranuli]